MMTQQKRYVNIRQPKTTAIHNTKEPYDYYEFLLIMKRLVAAIQ